MAGDEPDDGAHHGPPAARWLLSHLSWSPPFNHSAMAPTPHSCLVRLLCVGRLLGFGSFVVFQPLHKMLELYSGHLLPKVRWHQSRGKALRNHRIRFQNRLPNIGIVMSRPNIPEAGTNQRSWFIEFMAGDAGELSDELFRRPIGGGRHHRLGGRRAWLRRCFGACEGRHQFGGDGDLPALDTLQEGYHRGDLVVVQADRWLVDDWHDGRETLYEIFLRVD